MWSKNKKAQTVTEREHVGRIKEMDCIVCQAPGPSEAHEIKQGQWFTSFPLCYSCHRGPYGIHGTKTHLIVRKMDEMQCLNDTIRLLLYV